MDKGPEEYVNLAWKILQEAKPSPPAAMGDAVASLAGALMIQARIAELAEAVKELDKIPCANCKQIHYVEGGGS